MAASRSSKVAYRWQAGHRHSKAAAQALGVIISKFGGRGEKLAARAVVRAARAKSSPLHSLFEWNVRIAAQRYWENRARDLIRNLEVHIEGRGKKEIVLPAAVSFGPGDGYRTGQRVFESKDLRARWVRQALAEAESWMNRYKHLNELQDIFDAIVAAA